VWTPSSPSFRALTPGDPVRVVAGDLRGATGKLLEADDDRSWWVAFETRPGAASRTILVAGDDLRHIDEPRPSGPRSFAPVDPVAKRAAARRAAEVRAATRSRTSSPPALTQDQHRELLRRQLPTAGRGIAPDDVAVALQRVEERIARGRWSGRGRYERPVVRRRPDSRTGFRVRDIPCDDAELVIIRLLSLTLPDLQFSVTPDGHAFTGRRRGYHGEEDRMYVSALSPVIDAAADAVLDATAGAGGRVYVHAHARLVEGAADRRVLARLV
jgi:ribosomal protein L24